MGDADGAREIVGIYLELLPGRRDAVVAAVGDDSRARAAHALRSPSALVGALGLAARCRAIEDLVAAGAPVPPADLDLFAGECGLVAAALGRMAPDLRDGGPGPAGH